MSITEHKRNPLSIPPGDSSLHRAARGLLKTPFQSVSTMPELQGKSALRAIQNNIEETCLGSSLD
jgi:hypothetical protein